MKSKFRNRARMLSGFFILVAAILLVRLYTVQVVDGQKYARDAIGQYAVRAPESEDRGTIFFTRADGERVAAAIMKGGWRIAIIPKHITDAESLYTNIAEITAIDRERFLTSAAKRDDPYEEVAFKISDENASNIRKRGFPGILLVQDQWRFYPADELAAHAIGFFGFKGESKEGRYGLEQYWQGTLASRGASHYVNPFAEIFTDIGDLLSVESAAAQGDVITSIEPNVERELENALEEVGTRYNPKTAGGIVMDPKSGEVVAIAVWPSFNPNTYNLEKNLSVFGNPLVEDIYEMGSIMKPLTLAAAIDAGGITPATKYEDRGFVMKSGKKVSNFDGKARGYVNMQEVLNQSLNTGASFAVDSMGQNVFSQYVRNYGLGEKTGIDLPNEAISSIQSLESGSDVDYASASFGQGIATSPIAMVRALSALANGGALPNPHLTTALRHRSGIIREIPIGTSKQVLKPETVETVTRMLVKVYDDALLEGALREEHYSIAAKTGTAQIAMSGGGGYYADRYFHSFFGYLPAYDPKFIVFMYALEPKGEIYASRTLSKPFHTIAKYLINYYQIPPDR